MECTIEIVCVLEGSRSRRPRKDNRDAFETGVFNNLSKSHDGGRKVGIVTVNKHKHLTRVIWTTAEH